MSSYLEFLEGKTRHGEFCGFQTTFMPAKLFDFQKQLVDWAVRKGKAAIFADCGLGKTPMQLTWAENIVRKTNSSVLILTPLAVGHQTVKEGEKFGIGCRRSTDGKFKKGIVVSNYERLHYFNPSDFSGVVCDESSILKSFDGSIRGKITEFMRRIPYRLLATATASPNDYTELGTSSEALGQLGHMDMLNRFFKNDSNNSAVGRKYGEVVKWRFKGHAETPFWQWVCSWARAIRKPSDYGFDGSNFVLPELIEREKVIEIKTIPDGYLFSVPALGLFEQRQERKRTLVERCEEAASIANGNKNENFTVWCHQNDEGDMLEKLIPDSVQVSGKDSDESKEEKFDDFTSGKTRVLITKPKIGAWGMNWAHCHRSIYFPSHSFESYYQAVRRHWRFGQNNPVEVDLILTPGERLVMDNLRRKADKAVKMFENLIREMNRSMEIGNDTKFKLREEMPSWL